jgi:hypothetical protein
MKKALGIALLSVLVLLAGCATATRFTDRPMTKRGPHTEYAVEDTQAGFKLYVTYRRYQFIPESSAVNEARTSELLSLAHDIVAERGKALQPINEQRIRKSMGRNGVTGINSWSGMVTVVYANDDSGK